MDNTTSLISLNADVTKVINFAFQQNRIPIVRGISIKNNSPDSLENVVIKITSEPDIALPFEKLLQYIPTGQTFVLNEVNLVLKTDFLAGLTERILGTITIELYKDDIVLASQVVEITTLAFDEWQGSQFYPELLAAFITPNQPEIFKINARASELLGKWTGNPSLDAYQSKDTNRVKQQIAAVYEAFKEKDIVYCVPPPSFEIAGQRVRLCDAVIQQNMGTCLDLTLFYTACLEAMGLNPILILQEGHIFAGVWLEDISFPDAVQDDPSQVTKRLSDGIGEIAVVECTAFTAGNNFSFGNAEAAAIRKLQGFDSVHYIIDIHRARLSGIHPLPMRIQTENGWKIEHDISKNDFPPDAPDLMRKAVEIGDVEKTPSSKIVQWERKLLDLGLRNTLINMKLSRNIIPILSSSLGDLEDALSSGDEFGVLSRPIEWDLSGSKDYNFETINDLGEYGKLIQMEFKNKRLRSIQTESELNRSIINLYRSSRTSLEENGANTLYLALGVLRWFEDDVSQKPRYAPIVLLPIDIIRKSANKGYVIRLRDEEPQMNITLLEMFKQDYNIVVNGLDPLPQDENGIDIRKVFAIMRNAVMNQVRWDILESAYLGIFSFSQFVMWNDMRNRIKDLEKNKIVRSLLDGRLSWETDGMKIGERVSEEGVFIPIPADASQLYAIRAAGEGESFVLHGPPGTGKSQTITALFANALAHGKTVLFVAEKMAALSVVQKRLKALGLDPFCLELHSNKSRKRDVLDQLKVATEVTNKHSADDFARKASQIEKLRIELDDYSRKLHSIKPSGISLFEMVNRFEANRAASDSIQFDVNYAKAIKEDDLQTHKVLVQRLIAAAVDVGHPHDHPLRSVMRSQYSQHLKIDLPVVLTSCLNALEKVKKAGGTLVRELQLNSPNTKSDWDKLVNITSELIIWKDYPRNWAKCAQPNAYFNEVQSLAYLEKRIYDIKNVLMQTWDLQVLSLDGTVMEADWMNSASKWFLPKLLGQNRIVKQLSPYCLVKAEKINVETMLQLLKEYQLKLSEAERLFDLYGNDLGNMYNGENTDWNQIAAFCYNANRSANRLEELTENNQLRIEFAAVEKINSVLDAMISEWNEWQLANKSLCEMLQILPRNDSEPNWLENQLIEIEGIASNAGLLKEWMSWRGIVEESNVAGLQPVIAAYEEGLSHDAVLSCYYKSLYQILIITTVECEDTLCSFSGALFNEKIAQFKRVDKDLEDLVKEEIYCRLASKVPNFTREAAQSSELGILQRAIRSGGRGISIRRLFEQIPNLLPRLCPCMLMSPISAAQYLDPRRAPFDLVVFDEASQLQTCKAVGALARGTNAVIVGDPKQLPPTNFFSSNNIDEENLDIEDLESILDDCLALSFPDTHLLWHYRSKHESLIAFSNNQFYEGNLYTFPSVNDRESKVHFIPIKGFFDRGKTRQNKAEAEAIVAEIIRRYRDPILKELRIGVVTFNISQQNLIEDLFTEACKADPALEVWAYDSEDPLFIKNLENVQGDERDVILFSIGYGPDRDGKVYMNFGPLNREGGWRRLNVAVSRARNEMIVFSTLQPDMIDLSKTNAKGVEALKLFLEYSKSGSLSLNEELSIRWKAQQEGIANTICSALDDAGYATKKMVGHSEYRIDIGVVDPREPEQYLLGILLDGFNYGSAKTTRDREIAQVSVLNGLGWRIHRIWTMDWWDNTKKELDSLLMKLKKIIENDENCNDTDEMLKEKNEPIIKSHVDNTKLSSGYKENAQGQVIFDKGRGSAYLVANLPNRQITSEEYISPNRWKQVEQLIQIVIKIEAPISESLLVKRVLQSYGIARAGSRVLTKTQSVISYSHIKHTAQDGQRFYWQNEQDPQKYEGFRYSSDVGNNKRDAKDVPKQESANAVCVVLEEQIGLPKDDLIRETAKKLGYARSGPIVISAIESGINYAKETGRIRFDDHGYVTLS